MLRESPGNYFEHRQVELMQRQPLQKTRLRESISNRSEVLQSIESASAVLGGMKEVRMYVVLRVDDLHKSASVGDMELDRGIVRWARL